MKRILCVCLTLLMFGCGGFAPIERPAPPQETSQQAAARVTRQSLDEMALAVTAAYQTIGQRLDARIWSSDQAEQYWEKAHEVEQGILAARVFLGDGDLVSAELQRKAINLLLIELQKQLAEGS